jgi:hypothetical protein
MVRCELPVAIVANACELVEPAPPSVRLPSMEPTRKLIVVELARREHLLAVLGVGRISFEDLCSEDLFGQDKFNPLAALPYR